MAKIIVQNGRPSRSSWAKSVRSSFSRTIMGKAILENPSESRLGEGFQLGKLIRTPWKGLFLSVYVDDIKLAGKKQNINPIGMNSIKVILEEPKSFLDHVYLGCTQRPCEISKDNVDNFWTKFESRISAGRTELPFSQNLRIYSWSYDMEGHAKKCVERYCELANKTMQQLYKVSTPCIDDHHFKEEEMKSVGESTQVCSQIVLKCLNLARIGRLYILWSEPICTINHKMDESLWQTPESIDFLHASYTWIQNFGMWVILQNNADWTVSGLWLFGRSWRFKIHFWRNIVFGSHTFVPISWMCKKQTSVSHSSTESEIISLDTGLRLDGLPALELWDLIVSVLGNVSRVSDGTGQPVNGKNKSCNKIDVVHDIDLVPSNVQSASRKALLYVFEVNEAVIKMVIKGRSPTMRHVTRTHRVVLDWLFDTINFDTRNPNQIHWHQEPTRRHFNQREFHTWWIESFIGLACVVFVQY